MKKIIATAIWNSVKKNFYSEIENSGIRMKIHDMERRT